MGIDPAYDSSAFGVVVTQWVESTSYNDIFDAFRLALKFYSFRDSSELE